MANSKSSTPTFRDLYELVDSRANSIDAKIAHLSQRFDTLEAGRLSAMESKYAQMQIDFRADIANLKANQSIANTKVLIIWGIIVSVGTVILNLTIRKLAP